MPALSQSTHFQIRPQLVPPATMLVPCTAPSSILLLRPQTRLTAQPQHPKSPPALTLHPLSLPLPSPFTSPVSPCPHPSLLKPPHPSALIIHLLESCSSVPYGGSSSVPFPCRGSTGHCWRESRTCPASLLLSSSLSGPHTATVHSDVCAEGLVLLRAPCTCPQLCSPPSG